jgi:hypothetical protein
MAQNVTKAHRSVLTRCLAALALTGVYCFSLVGTSAIFLTASTTTADAQRGRGRGGGRGGGFGRGRGRGGGFVVRGRGRGRGWGGGCAFNPIYGRVVCY